MKTARLANQAHPQNLFGRVAEPNPHRASKASRARMARMVVFNAVPVHAVTLEMDGTVNRESRVGKDPVSKGCSATTRSTGSSAALVHQATTGTDSGANADEDVTVAPATQVTLQTHLIDLPKFAYYMIPPPPWKLPTHYITYYYYSAVTYFQSKIEKHFSSSQHICLMYMLTNILNISN